MIRFIGSDGHSCNRRTTRIREALKTIEKLKAGQKNIMMGYSKKVIDGEDFIPISPKGIRIAGRWQQFKDKLSFL